MTTFILSRPIRARQIGPELRGEVTLAGDDPSLDVEVALDQDGSWDFGQQIRGEVTLGTFLTTIQPGLQGDAPSQLWGGFQIYIDGEQVPPWQLGELIVVGEHLTGTSTLGFSVPMRGEGEKVFDNPHGTFPLALGPPPGGKASIDVDTTFFVGPVKTPLRLLTDGMVENVTEGVGPTGDQRTYTAIGKHGRYDRRKVTVTHPPGHGLSMEEIIESILAEMDLEVDLVGVDADPRYKEIAAVDILGWPFIQELLAIKGQALIWGRDGEASERATSSTITGWWRSQLSTGRRASRSQAPSRSSTTTRKGDTPRSRRSISTRRRPSTTPTATRTRPTARTRSRR
jgi:hypothetical protein